jgi:broad-specificity NMP kinase
MRHKPNLIIVTGRPGSGKTTLSKELGKILYLPVVIRDEIKEGYINTFNIRHDELPKDTNGVVTSIFFKDIEFLLSNNVSVIAEAAFQHHVWEPKVTELKKYANVVIVICEIDDEIAARRHLTRGVDEPKREFYHGDKRVTHFKETGEFLPATKYESPSLDVPTIKVSTLDGYNPKLEKVREQIVSLLDIVS